MEIAVIIGVLLFLFAGKATAQKTDKTTPENTGRNSDRPAPVENLSEVFSENPVFPDHIEQWRSIAIAEAHNLPVSLVLAVIWTESSGDPNAVNGDSRGLMQLTNIAWRQIRGMNPTAAQVFNPYQNIQVGCAYLRWLRTQTNSYFQTLEAYNWGIGNIRTHDNVPEEVTLYARRVINRAHYGIDSEI